MLQLARRGRLSSVAPKLQGFFPAPSPTFVAAISSTPASRASDNPGNESNHAQISRASTDRLKARLAAQNLKTGGKRSYHVERQVRSQSASNRQQKATTATRHVEEVKMPDPRDFTEKPNDPIRVPLTPDNKFACYHRHEMVPKVAPPHKPEAVTVLPDASYVIDTEDTLTDMLENISVEAKNHKSQSQYEKEHKEAKNTVKGIIQDIAGGMRGMMSREGSVLHTVVNFPVDLVKDMVEDVFEGGKQFVKEEKQQRKEKSGREEPRVLTQKERTTL